LSSACRTIIGTTETRKQVRNSEFGIRNLRRGDRWGESRRPARARVRVRARKNPRHRVRGLGLWCGRPARTFVQTTGSVRPRRPHHNSTHPGSALPTRNVTFYQRAPRECPLQRGLGPYMAMASTQHHPKSLETTRPRKRARRTPTAHNSLHTTRGSALSRNEHEIIPNSEFRIPNSKCP
jgi:hypothetical protein